VSLTKSHLVTGQVVVQARVLIEVDQTLAVPGVHQVCARPIRSAGGEVACLQQRQEAITFDEVRVCGDVDVVAPGRHADADSCAGAAVLKRRELCFKVGDDSELCGATCWPEI
jgi:hypothetical protein